jgi:AAA domain
MSDTSAPAGALPALEEHHPNTGSRDKPTRAQQFASKLLTIPELLKLDPPEPLIADVLYRATLAVLFGAPGSYKTIVALDWAQCVAGCLPWQAREVRGGPVLYVAAEGSASLGQRFAAWRKGFNLEPPEQLLVLPMPVDLRNRHQVGDVAEWAAETRPALAVFDTLARCMVGGDENSAKDMGELIDGADRIRQASGATVLLVHHTGKDGIDARGSSALRGAADTMVKVEADGRLVTLRNQPPAGKQKDAEPFEPIRLRADKIELPNGQSVVLRTFGRLHTHTANDRHAETIRAALADAFSETGASRAVLCEHTGLSVSQVSRAANTLLRRGIIGNEGSKARPLFKALP